MSLFLDKIGMPIRDRSVTQFRVHKIRFYRGNSIARTARTRYGAADTCPT